MKLLFLEDIIKKEQELTEFNVKSIHGLILKNNDSKNAGKYRQKNVLISGTEHIPPKHFKIQELMSDMIEEYKKVWSDLHPVISASLLHGEFVKIHPFVDGNGRVARLLLNFELMRNGYPPIVIKKEQRLEYYEALDTAHTTMDYSLFIEIVKKCTLDSLELWINM